MINKIINRLELPPVTRVFHIEEIATQEEIETAMRIRFTEGKHVIPVPSIEEQRKIAQAINNLFVLIESIKSSLS